MVGTHQVLAENLVELNSLYKKISQIGQDVADRILEIYCLYQISSTMNGPMDIQASIDTFKKLLQQVLRIDAFALFMMDEPMGGPRYMEGYGFEPAVLDRLSRVLRSGLSEELFERSSSIVYSPFSKSHSANGHFGELAELGGSFFFFPIVSESEHPIGALVLSRRAPKQLLPMDTHLLEKVCAQFALVVDRILIYNHTRELSITDDLTGVFNRRYFNQRFEREMQRSLRYHRPLTVIMADIDHFKSVNDAHGHFYGDEVLQRVARILEHNLRKADILARFGGEEFVVLLPEIDKQHAINVAEKLRRAVETHPFPKGSPQNGGKITMSLGLASFPEDATVGNALLELADQALYRAKSNGRNRVEVNRKDPAQKSSFAERYRLAAAGTRQ